jgi:hypothetical protein
VNLNARFISESRFFVSLALKYTTVVINSTYSAVDGGIISILSPNAPGDIAFGLLM